MDLFWAKVRHFLYFQTTSLSGKIENMCFLRMPTRRIAALKQDVFYSAIHQKSLLAKAQTFGGLGFLKKVCRRERKELESR